MPINRHELHKNFGIAQAFLTAQSGVLLHELGHHAAMNTDKNVGGHLVVEDGTGGGGFRPMEQYISRLPQNAERRGFICAAGATTEMHFSGTTLHHRLGLDIALYIQSNPPANLKMKTNDLLAQWQKDYLKSTEEIAPCIEKNFDRCTKLIESKRFLIEAHHVIPSWILETPCGRSWWELYREILATGPKSVRLRVLNVYLAGKPRH